MCHYNSQCESVHERLGFSDTSSDVHRSVQMSDFRHTVIIAKRIHNHDIIAKFLKSLKKKEAISQTHLSKLITLEIQV